MRALVLLGVLSTLRCGYSQVRGQPARLQVIAEPEDARVYVDERFVASARVLAQRPRELSPGSHRLSIQAPGYFPHDVAVELPAGTTTVRISLRPIPP
ncbi:MAG: PEGA domain-containing protein [Myxococcota bacterium]